MCGVIECGVGLVSAKADKNTLKLFELYAKKDPDRVGQIIPVDMMCNLIVEFRFSKVESIDILIDKLNKVKKHLETSN